MDEKLEVLFKLAGNSNRYQVIISVITFVIWINVNFLSVSVGLLEKNPHISYYDSGLNKTVNGTMNATICQWEGNYTITRNYSHSLTSTFEVYCSPIKTGVIGSSTFAGNLIGCFLFQYMVEKFGRRKTIFYLLFPALFSIFALAISFDFWMMALFLFFVEGFCVALANTSFLLSSENTDSKTRSVLGAFINSAFGVCGVLYTLLYKYVGSWRIVFMLSMFFQLGVLTVFLKFTYESPRFFLTKNDFEAFIESLRNIARVNYKLEEFDEKLKDENSDEKKAYNFTKNFIDERSGKTILRTSVTLNNNEINEIESDKDSKLSNQTAVDRKNDQSDDLREKGIQAPAEKPKKKKQKRTFTIVDLVRYPSIRSKFLSLCFIWLSSAGSYYGLSINLKNLAGDLYFNSIVNYIFEIAFNIMGGYMISIRILGRKRTMMFYYSMCLTCLFIHILFKTSGQFDNIVLSIIRLSVSANFIILYTYTIEIYPSPVRAKGFGVNSGLARLAPALFPFLIEIWPQRIFLVYLFMNITCFILLLVNIPETLGRPLQETIPELKKEKLEKKERERRSKLENIEKERSMQLEMEMKQQNNTEKNKASSSSSENNSENVEQLDKENDNDNNKI